MPNFTIERTFDVPNYKHSTYEAASVQDACALALADDDWSGMQEDIESPGPTRLTGAWAGEEAYKGDCIRHPTGTGLSDPDEISNLFRIRVDETMYEVMADLTTGDTPVELQLAVDAATDILVKAAWEVRKLNVPA